MYVVFQAQPELDSIMELTTNRIAVSLVVQAAISWPSTAERMGMFVYEGKLGDVVQM